MNPQPTNMEQLFKNLLEEAKKDKKKFLALKNAVVKCQQFELAANLREIEKELFPVTEEQISAKERVEKIDLLLRMVEVNVNSTRICWLIDAAISAYGKKKGKFALSDASDLIVKSKQLFEED